MRDMNSVSTAIVFVLIWFMKLSLPMQVNSATSPLPPEHHTGSAYGNSLYVPLCSPEIRQAVWPENYALGLYSQI